MNANAQALLPYLHNPNVRKVLDYIAACEGADYDIGFGGVKLNDLSWHPGTAHKFRNTQGRLQTTTAAGRYQFLLRTFKDAAKKLGLTDFSAQSQDLAAIYLLKNAGALDDVVKGNMTPAIQKIGKVWASLPSSPYAQKKTSWDFARNFFDGKVTAPTQMTNVQTQPDGSAISSDVMAAGNNGGFNMPQQLPKQQDFEGVYSLGMSDQSPTETLRGLFGNTSSAPQQDVFEAPIFTAALDKRLSDVKNNAVNQFLSRGQAAENAPSLNVPKPLMKAINNIVADL